MNVFGWIILGAFVLLGIWKLTEIIVPDQTIVDTVLSKRLGRYAFCVMYLGKVVDDICNGERPANKGTQLEVAKQVENLLSEKD